jgi:hypothetical protein
MKCDAKIRPFPNDTEVKCEASGQHDMHYGYLRDYAYKGSVTRMEWTESDRRNYHGDWPGLCYAASENRCILPSGHRGSHAA